GGPKPRLYEDLCRASLVDALVAATAIIVTLGFGADARAQDEKPAAEEKPPKCDYDINADCRSQDDEPVKQNREGAPVDLTGYWVSVVTEDWRWRMMTPPKGDIASLPLNVEGERVTNSWDPERETDQCKAFGAAGLMRNPMRVRLSWDDDETLRLDTDHGMQTREFHFVPIQPNGRPASLQGDSAANWQESGLRVVTRNLAAGYLRKNGVPYSADTLLTEYFDRISAFGEDWLVVTTVVTDPAYLSREFITSTHFKKIEDGEGWNPTPCD
ncbi:MAG: hypothetical protein WD795_06520, partial [Woeseia sp.]